MGNVLAARLCGAIHSYEKFNRKKNQKSKKKTPKPNTQKPKSKLKPAGKVWVFYWPKRWLTKVHALDSAWGITNPKWRSFPWQCQCWKLMKFKITRYHFLLWEDWKLGVQCFSCRCGFTVKSANFKSKKKPSEINDVLCHCWLGLVCFFAHRYQHNPYFINLVNSSNDDQEGLWFILPLLCWFCRAKTTVEQEQLFQSLMSAKSKLSEGIHWGRGGISHFFKRHPIN